MPSTRNLQASGNWVLPQVNFRPITVGGDDPALTSANLVKGIMLGAPFRWAWNRGEQTVTLAKGSQQLTLPTGDVSHIENVMLQSVESTATRTEINLAPSLTPDPTQQRPASMALQMEDMSGAQTLRFNTTADVDYSVTLTYQRRSIPMTSLAATWAPIPDALQYIFEEGMLAFLASFNSDPRAPVMRQSFAGRLLGAQDGLTAMERNIFLGDFLAVQQAGQRAAMQAQMGTQGRTQ